MTPLDERSKELRRQIVRAMSSAQQGHIASAFSLVEILRVLFDDILQYDAAQPKCPERDRFILSKGHGCLALYVLLAEKGFFAEDELWRFCRSDGILGGHPSHNIPGVECSTGSLGHGLPIGVGMALANRDRRVFVVMGDGECNEGSVWEAAMIAAKYKLHNLTVLVDYNGQQSYASVEEVQPLGSLADKWHSFGWFATDTDGHYPPYLKLAIEEWASEPKHPAPRVIICHTVKGKGVSFIENNLSWHHRNQLTVEEEQAILKELEE